MEFNEKMQDLGDACLAQRHLHRIEPDGRGEGVVRRHVDDDGALRFGPRLLIGGHERVAATRQQAEGKNQQACEEGTKDVGHCSDLRFDYLRFTIYLLFSNLTIYRFTGFLGLFPPPLEGSGEAVIFDLFSFFLPSPTGGVW